jgi:hypothetical protein
MNAEAVRTYLIYMRQVQKKEEMGAICFEVLISKNEKYCIQSGSQWLES